MQKFEHSSAVVQSAEFIQFAVDDVDQNISLLDALTNGMKWVMLQTFLPGRPTTGGILRQTVNMDELQVVGHI